MKFYPKHNMIAKLFKTAQIAVLSLALLGYAYAPQMVIASTSNDIIGTNGAMELLQGAAAAAASSAAASAGGASAAAAAAAAASGGSDDDDDNEGGGGAAAAAAAAAGSGSGGAAAAAAAAAAAGSGGASASAGSSASAGGSDDDDDSLNCHLEVTKSVNKYSARAGDILTYTIRVSNTGTGNCTGTGVKIVDVVDPNLQYLNHDLSSNIDAGYVTLPVYKSSNRTLYFNGNTLNPGETGTIRWTARVLMPIQCGDFEVRNQAKATASELNNFMSWERSEWVVTDIDYDCPNPQPNDFNCEDNVSFRISDNSIERGESATLTWDVNGADSVFIDEINETSFEGSERVSPREDTTYTLTARKDNETIHCPVYIDVYFDDHDDDDDDDDDDDRDDDDDNDRLRCDLDISDSRIERGDTITLSWDTRGGDNITIVDDRGREIVDTNDDEDSIRIKPTRDTEYTLIVEDGSRDEECSVNVEVEDDENVLLEERDQDPLVAGIALSQVPYTGFEAGPFLTLLFYVFLAAWALYVAYFLVMKKRNVAGETAFTATPGNINDLPQGATHAGYEQMKKAEDMRPDVFTLSTAAAAIAPTNLPTGTTAEPGESYIADTPVSNSNANIEVTELENRAHAQKALLSSDAVRHFMSITDGPLDRNETLDQVIASAKQNYPLEDGWVVINESRMNILCETCAADSNKTAAAGSMTILPQGSSSLAEAIVTGNITAAYEMLGNRPMFTLADAASDLDALYRSRKGDDVKVSNMLLKESESLSDEKIKEMIQALTSAIDGTYSDEASAVKMAILKSVKLAG